MGDQPMTGKAAGELTIREASLPAKLRDWREKLSMKAKRGIQRTTGNESDAAGG